MEKIDCLEGMGKGGDKTGLDKEEENDGGIEIGPLMVIKFLEVVRVGIRPLLSANPKVPKIRGPTT